MPKQSDKVRRDLAFEKWDRSRSNPYYEPSIQQGAYDNADEVETAFMAGWKARKLDNLVRKTEEGENGAANVR